MFVFPGVMNRYEEWNSILILLKANRLQEAFDWLLFYGS